ncbi:hypothetical protein OLK001_08060 [Synechocystis sp. LKSZ1]
MPLFHNLSVAEFKAKDINEITPILWLMLAFFSFPILALITILFTQAKFFRWFHFSLTILYSLLNFSHLLADLNVHPILWYQITLMVMLLIVGFLLNVVSFQWLQER